jgi:hypothetical protein
MPFVWRGYLLTKTKLSKNRISAFVGGLIRRRRLIPRKEIILDDSVSITVAEALGAITATTVAVSITAETGTLYLSVYAAATASRTFAQVKAGTGAGFISRFERPTVTGQSVVLSVTGLSAETAYRFYLGVEDRYTNQSTVRALDPTTTA